MEGVGRGRGETGGVGRCGDDMRRGRLEWDRTRPGRGDKGKGQAAVEGRRGGWRLSEEKRERQEVARGKGDRCGKRNGGRRELRTR